MVNFNINRENFILRRKKIFIEIPVFLIYFALTFSDSITSEFIKYRTCYVVLGFKELNCALLDTNSSLKTISVLERKVKPSAIVVTSTISIVQSLIPPLLCFFIGPWSNRYGRKPVMLYSTFALVLQYTVMIFISALPQISPWYILLSQIMLCVSGGIPALVAVMFSYLADTVTEQHIGIRIAFLEAIRSCGILLGMSTGMATLNSSSYSTVYSLSLVILLMAWSFIWFYVPESVTVLQSEDKLQNFFNFESLLTTVKTTLKPRENYNRILLLTTIFVIVVYITAVSGSTSVLYSYFQNQFHWNFTRCNDYGVVIGVTTIIGGLICVYFLYLKLNCNELIAVTAGLISLSTGSFTLAMAVSTPIIQIGGCMQCFGPAVLSMTRTLIAKLVPREEVSIIFAVVASLETVWSLIGVSFFALIYSTTTSSNPATFLYVTSALHILGLILVSTLLLIQKYWNPVRFTRIENEGC